jgi:hypothetical protein
VANSGRPLADLEAERDRIVLPLGEDGPVWTPDELPNEAGIYALWAVEQTTISDLGLEDVEGEPPLASRPLYVGKAQDSLLKRVAEKHLASGDTGHSTVRRTFAGLLDFESRPRRSGIAAPTPRQLRTITTNFDLTKEDDDRLTEWMQGNLVIRAAISPWNPLGQLERAVGAVLRPPLDQERSPMWEPNPWREQVTDARRRLQSRARIVAGLNP